MAEFVTYKRWRLLRTESENPTWSELVRVEIAPHDGKLEGCVRLGLHRIARHLILSCAPALAKSRNLGGDNII